MGKLSLTGHDATRSRLAVLPFSPLDIAGLVAWWDASDARTITDAGSGAVSQWNDKSGNGRNLTQSTSGKRPTTGTRTKNSLNVLDFDGSDDQLVYNTPFFYALGSMTAFVLFLVDADPTQTLSTLISEHANGANGNEFTCRYKASNLNVALNESLSLRYERDGAAGDPTDGSYHIVTWTDTGTTVTDQVDDQSADTTTYTRTGGFSPATFSVGGADLLAGNSPRAHNGTIAEILIYDDVLSATNIATVKRYLRGRWGL